MLPQRFECGVHCKLNSQNMRHVQNHRKPSHLHTCLQILNPSTPAEPITTKLQNLFVALVNMDIF